MGEGGERPDRIMPTPIAPTSISDGRLLAGAVQSVSNGRPTALGTLAQQSGSGDRARPLVVSRSDRGRPGNSDESPLRAAGQPPFDDRQECGARHRGDTF